MATATEVLDVNLSHWIPGTRFFQTSDGQYLVIDADVAEYPNGRVTYRRRQTAVLYCNLDATVTDLIPDHTFPPGTTAEDVIAQLGYTLEEQ